MSTWITVCVIALIPMLLRARRALLPLRTTTDSPPRFARPFGAYKITTFTGRAGEVGKRTESTTRGSIGSSRGAYQEVGSVSGSVWTTHTTIDQFFVTAIDGTTDSFQLRDFDVAIADGNVVSLAAVSRGKRSNVVFLVHNHTTGRTYFNDKALRSITFPWNKYYVALLTVLVLTFPVLCFFGAVEMWQIRRFKVSGFEPLGGGEEGLEGVRERRGVGGEGGGGGRGRGGMGRKRGRREEGGGEGECKRSMPPRAPSSQRRRARLPSLGLRLTGPGASRASFRR